MKKYLILSCCVLMSFVCIQKSDIIGLYEASSDLYCKQIEFKSNNTFEYAFTNNYSSWNIYKGNWIREGDTITLNTFEHPYNIVKEFKENILEPHELKTGNMIYTYLDSNRYDSIIVKGYKIFKELAIIDTISYRDSLFIPKELNIRILRIDSKDLREYLYAFIDTIHDWKCTLYDIRVNKTLLEGEYLYNQKCIIKRNKIYFISPDGQLINDPLKKTSLKNKKF